FAFPLLKHFRPEFFLSGSNGTVLRYDAGLDTWTDISVPGESLDLLAVHGTKRRNVWVGAFHQTPSDLRMHRWNGTSWESHPITSAVLPAAATDGRPRPGGIRTFGSTNTYASVVAQQSPATWWLVRWNGSQWILLEAGNGGRASGGMFAQSPAEIYFVGEPGTGPGLWRWSGAELVQLPPGMGLPSTGILNGVVEVEGALVVSGLTDAGRQGIWRGTFETSFVLEFEATHGNHPFTRQGNNWCLADDRGIRVVGVDAANRSTLYKRALNGTWFPDPELGAQAPCGDAVQAASTPTATLIALESCTQGGNDVQALNVLGAGWSLENPPGNHRWRGVWATTATNLLIAPNVLFLSKVLSDATLFPPK
ncbi:MAG: hypothetical protein ACYTG6_15210, partial [Planctomycetota bacterium]